MKDLCGLYEWSWACVPPMPMDTPGALEQELKAVASMDFGPAIVRDRLFDIAVEKAVSQLSQGATREVTVQAGKAECAPAPAYCRPPGFALAMDIAMGLVQGDFQQALDDIHCDHG